MKTFLKLVLLLLMCNLIYLFFYYFKEQNNPLIIAGGVAIAIVLWIVIGKLSGPRSVNVTIGENMLADGTRSNNIGCLAMWILIFFILGGIGVIFKEPLKKFGTKVFEEQVKEYEKEYEKADKNSKKKPKSKPGEDNRR